MRRVSVLCSFYVNSDVSKLKSMKRVRNKPRGVRNGSTGVRNEGNGVRE